MINTLGKELAGLWVAGAAITQSHLRLGTNIFDHDWDALVVLDACRVDALAAVADEFDFITDLESKWSVGSTSKEWLENTFVEKYRHEVENTAYVTANSFALHLEWEDNNRLDYLLGQDSRIIYNDRIERLVKDDLLSADDFLLFDSLWDKLNDATEHGELHPAIVTDRAIRAGREYDPDRLIVHYMQPHHPFIYSETPSEYDTSPFKYLSNGGDRSVVWRAYLDNLRFVLEHVARFLSNFEGDTVVITADHGELFGRYLRSHTIGVPHPKLRKVPWVTTTATDDGTHEPEEYDLHEQASESELERRLEALGYR